MTLQRAAWRCPVAEPASSGHGGAVSSEPDVLTVGREPAGRVAGPWHGRMGQLVGWSAVVAVAALALVQVGPTRWWSTDTGLTLVTFDGSAYGTIDVDTGGADQLPPGTDLVDVVRPIVWLQTNADATRNLSGAFPPWTGGREVVGAVGGGLLTLVGNSRVRRIQLWDAGYSGVAADLGTATGVTGVNEREALVTSGCLVLGCPTALLDLVDGSRVDVAPPAGYRLVDTALAADGTIALGVSADNGSFAAGGQRSVLVGRPDHWREVDELAGVAWDDVVWGPDGWLVVMQTDGDVTLWREGVGVVLVQLPDGERVLGVSASQPGHAGGTGVR
jgi:hypothetical protein